MEIILIEKRTFEALMTRFEAFVRKADVNCRRYGELKRGKWYDNQDVCLILRISLRALQSLRESGRLPYTQIQHKIYYLPSDVQRVLGQLVTREKKEKTTKTESHESDIQS